MAVKILCFWSIFAVCTCYDLNQPNIVFIVCDDIGWNDVSLHGSNQIMTPNIDMIGYEGIVLQNYYTDAQGTASRSALFTGKYPFRMGTQGESIGVAEDRGVPVSETLLPTYLQDLGYATHLVGKWQLGKSREYFLPTHRGFDTFYGFLGGSVDYYTYNNVESCNGTEFFGLDLFNNSEPVLNESRHLTEVLTRQAVNIIKDHEPSVPLYLHVAHAAAHIGGGRVNLQVPARFVAANDHIAHSARRLYAGLVTDLDRSVGEIVSALAETNMLYNTLIVIVSDNGAPAKGPHQNFGSNVPLRGTKGTPWEGAVRSTAVLWHNKIKPQTWKGIFHVTDWMPTLLSAVGGNISDPIDGIDQWYAMTHDEEPPRSEVIIAVDDLNEWGTLRYGDLKLVIGNVDKCCSDHYGAELGQIRLIEPLYEKALIDSETAIVFREVLNKSFNFNEAFAKRSSYSLEKLKHKENNTELCLPTKAKGCLFNITEDPSETKDLWYEKYEVVKNLTSKFRLQWSEIKPRPKPSFDLEADPAKHGFIWYTWRDNFSPSPAPMMTQSRYPLQMSTEEFQYYMDINMNSLKEKLHGYVKSMTDTLFSNVKRYTLV